MALQLGKTKVFLRSGQGAELDAHRARVLRNSAAVIQRHAKARSDRKSFTLQRQASVHIQSHWRGESSGNNKAFFFFFEIAHVI